MNIRDKVAIVTGGAGGIGRATVHRLAKERAKVAIVDIGIEAANEVAKEIRSLGCEAITLQVDVTKLDATNKMAKAVLDTFGQIDILANIAGGAIPGKEGPFAQSEKEVWERIMNLNFYGTLNCCRAVINNMIERKSGKIVNMSSTAALLGQARTADYAASKGAIIAFTKSLAIEVAPYGINVNCVSPGIVGTPRVLNFPEEFRQNILKSVKLGRLAKPEEIANMVVFLASDEADYITGANFVIDGGRSLG